MVSAPRDYAKCRILDYKLYLESILCCRLPKFRDDSLILLGRIFLLPRSRLFFFLLLLSESIKSNIKYNVNRKIPHFVLRRSQIQGL